jgi:predicted protein tyrosine phosphatase
MDQSLDRLVPFTITICGVSELDRWATTGVSHVLSILDPDFAERPRFAAFREHRRLELAFHDIVEPRAGQMAPQQVHVNAILAFADTLVADPARATHVLVHCHMGISRSSAALAVLLARVRPEVAAVRVWEEVLRLRERAWPNLRLIELGDVALGRQGELIAALAGVYRRQLDRYPQLRGYFEQSDRKREVEHAERAY